MQSKLAWRPLWQAIGALLIAFVSYMSLVSDPPPLPGGTSYKIGHVLAYLTLSLWYAQLTPRGRARVAVMAAFVAMGIVLEYLQGLTDTRGFEYSDMLINAFGAAVGYLLGHTPLDRGLAWFEGLAGVGRA